tara:strand:- start:1168 stop:2208 length:1041 start_codon:yes stop_codon:yes gene_type:complete
MSFGSGVEIKKLPNREDILGCITDEQIFAHFLGGIPRKPICSPIRNDKIPSFSLFHSDRYNKMMYKDFATGDRGDVFVFVMRLFDISSITDAFCFIANEFMLDQFQTEKIERSARKSYVSKSNIGKVKKDRIRLSVKAREWSIKDKEYWNAKYGFTLSQLKYSCIQPISHYFMNDYCKQAEELAYAFIEEKDGLVTYKIYQPLSEQKWINNNDFSVWELWQQMPKKGKNLIITSSRKDAMSILFAYCKPELISSCALQSENTNPKPQIIEELKSRFENIYVLYDNDFTNENNPGRKAGEKFCSEYGLKQLEIPESYGVKDPSDYLERYGKKQFKQLIKNLLTNVTI